MITITYKQEPYYYDDSGKQPYDIETKIVLDKDIEGKEAIRAFMRLLNTATYPMTLSSLKCLVDQLEDEGYKDNDRIMY